AFPTTPDEEHLKATIDSSLIGACSKRARSIIDHMSTANVARDLDVLRGAVGDEKLSYAGLSYGSYLGVTYANLFPDNVRALVVDGVLVPIAWATGRDNEAATLPFSTRLRSDAGSQATLKEFFRLCDEAGPACAFSGGSEARFAALAQRARQSPLQIVFPDGFTLQFTYSDLIALTRDAMYSSPGWGGFAALLAEFEHSTSPALLGARLQAYLARHGWSLYPNAIEGSFGVSCSETDNPGSYEAWSLAGAQADEQFGYFGRIWTWLSSSCAEWTGRDADRYIGTFTKQTAHPVLVVGNQFDPATRYEGAVVVHDLLPSSALLTVHGWGHTSLFLSACADSAITRYLVDGATPSTAVCEQDVKPFAPPPATRTAERRRIEALRSPRGRAPIRSRWDLHGRSWQSAQGSQQDAFDPRVAIDDDGGATFAWALADGASGRSRIQLRSRSRRGELGPVSDISNLATDAFGTQLGADSSGDAVLAWETFDFASGSHVHARTRSSKGRLGPLLAISDPALDSFGVQVAVDGDGDALFAWGVLDSATFTIHVQSRSLSREGVLGPIADVSDPGLSALGGQVATNERGESILTFPVFDPALGRPVVHARMRSPQGLLGPVFTVSDTPLAAPEARAAINDDGTVVFDWLAYDGQSGVVQTRTRSVAGELGAVDELSQAGQDAWDPQVAIDDDGNALSTWWLSTRDGARVQARARSQKGTAGPRLELSDPSQDGYEPQVALDGDGNALLTWLAFDRAGVRVQARSRSSRGVVGSLGTVSNVADDAVGAQVAVNKDGAAALAWSLFDADTYRVQGRVRSRRGAFGSPFELSTASRDAVEAQVNATTRNLDESLRRRQAAAAGG
ncbi:MAG TPA: alpha/beta hydrolase, partial [Solirubrobacteraceae bacterium]